MKAIKKIILCCIIMYTNIYAEEESFAYQTTKIGETYHEYAGYTILGLVAGNIYLGLENEKKYDPDNKKLHEDIGSILLVTAISSTIVGTYAYRDELFDFSDGITKQHVHALLGLGALVFMVSNQTYDLEDHKRNGIIAGSLAISAFTITLF